CVLHAVRRNMLKKYTTKQSPHPTRHTLFSGIVLFFALCVVPLATAQQPQPPQQQPPPPQPQEEDKGIDQGNYNIRQSIEFGGRITSISGDEQAYDTMVNLQQGPRLLNFTTEMRSLDHHATFFDRLFFSNFGYGGDPNVVSVLRISKNKWYSFDAMFRHDE